MRRLSVDGLFNADIHAWNILHCLKNLVHHFALVLFVFWFLSLSVSLSFPPSPSPLFSLSPGLAVWPLCATVVASSHLLNVRQSVDVFLHCSERLGWSTPPWFSTELCPGCKSGANAAEASSMLAQWQRWCPQGFKLKWFTLATDPWEASLHDCRSCFGSTKEEWMHLSGLYSVYWISDIKHEEQNREDDVLERRGNFVIPKVLFQGPVCKIGPNLWFYTGRRSTCSP